VAKRSASRPAGPETIVVRAGPGRVARAPRGSIYHHFPGGKSQLAVEAAELEGREVRAGIERSLDERGLAETLTMFGEIFRRRVKDRPERLGCPVAAGEDAPLESAVAGLHQALAATLPG